MYRRKTDRLISERQKITHGSRSRINKRQCHFPRPVTDCRDNSHRWAGQNEFWIGVEQTVRIGDSFDHPTGGGIEQPQSALQVGRFQHCNDPAAVGRNVRRKVSGTCRYSPVVASIRVQHADDAVIPPTPSRIGLIGRICHLPAIRRKVVVERDSPGPDLVSPFPANVPDDKRWICL